MGVKRYTVDSNILVYAVDQDAGERHTLAVEVVDRCVELDCVLSLQALSEFFFVTTRKGKMPQEDAQAQIADWQQLFPVITPKTGTLNHAITAVRRHKLSFWDAMMWAVAKENGVSVLLSEDFQAGGRVESVRFQNPFIDSTDIW